MYTGADVKTAVERIRRECPDARISLTDFDFSLSVAKSDLSTGYVVFQAERDDIGQREVIGDLDTIIAALQNDTVRSGS